MSALSFIFYFFILKNKKDCADIYCVTLNEDMEFRYSSGHSHPRHEWSTYCYGCFTPRERAPGDH